MAGRWGPLPPAPAWGTLPATVRQGIVAYAVAAVAFALAGGFATLAASRLSHGAARRALVAPDAVGSTTVTVGLVLVLAAALVKLRVVQRLRRGRARARIVLLVLAALEVVAIGLRLDDVVATLSIGPFAALGAAFQVVGILALVGAVVMLFRPGSTAWFRRVP